MGTWLLGNGVAVHHSHGGPPHHPGPSPRPETPHVGPRSPHPRPVVMVILLSHHVGSHTTLGSHAGVKVGSRASRYPLGPHHASRSHVVAREHVRRGTLVLVVKE